MIQGNQPTAKKVATEDQSGRLPFGMGQLLKMIVEHGVARVLIVVGLIIPLYFLYDIPSEDWRTNLSLLVAASVAVVAGSAVRVMQMINGVFSGRIMLLMCQKCRKPITQFDTAGFTGKPPAVAQCKEPGCMAVNIFQ